MINHFHSIKRTNTFEFSQIKIDKNIDTIKNKMKMMVLNNDFSKIFEPLFEIDSVRSGTSGPTNGPLWTVRNQTSERTCLNSEHGTWETSLSLEMLPTKPSEVKVKVEDRKREFLSNEWPWPFTMIQIVTQILP